MPQEEYKRNFDELVELLNLSQIVKTPTRQLSLGQRMRCEIAASLLHSPKILFLDEPTIGLDAVSKLAVRSFIKELNQRRGTTVILTTHDMQDIEALASRVILIGKGRILLDGALESLKKQFSGGKTLRIEYQGNTPELPKGLSWQEKGENHGVLLLAPELLSVSEAVSSLSAQVELRDVSVEDTPIDEIVANLYREYRI